MSEIVLKYPPGEDESGKLLNFSCKECQYEEGAFGSFKIDNFEHTAVCPVCGGEMVVDLSTMSIGIKNTRATRKRRANDLTRRNEQMKTKQWDNHDVGISRQDVRFGRRKFKNATPGGPLDPNSKFNKRTK